MRFFFDNNMAPGHAKALHALADDYGSQVFHLMQKYPKNRSVADDVWLGDLGKEGDWIVVSNDRRIWTTPHLREAWRKSGLTVFFLVDSWGNLDYWRKIEWLIRSWPGIMSVSKNVAQGAAFEVKRPPRPLVQLRT